MTEEAAARDVTGLLARVRAGEEIIITREGAPDVVARLGSDEAIRELQKAREEWDKKETEVRIEMADENPNPAGDDKPDDRRTPTELLIEALEHAEDMEEVMVIFRLKQDEHGHSGMGWATQHSSLYGKFAFIEEAKIAMWNAIYQEKEPRE